MVGALPWPSNLRNKLSKCGEQGHWAWNEWRCGSPACLRCSRRYAARESRKIITTMSGATNNDLSMLTIMIGIADDVDEIGAHWTKFKSDIRNKVNAMRRSSQGWESVSLTGWLEADPVTFEDYAIFGSEKRTMLTSLNSPRWRSDGAPSWLVHVHGIAIHRAVNPNDLHASLTARWQGDRRVHIQPFNQGRSEPENVRSVVRYSTKFRPGRWIRGSFDQWSPAWLAEYYSWAESYSRGWQSLRLRIKNCNHDEIRISTQ